MVSRGGRGLESVRRGGGNPGRESELCWHAGAGMQVSWGGRRSRLAKLQTASGAVQPGSLEGGGDRVRPDMEATGRLGGQGDWPPSGKF